MMMVRTLVSRWMVLTLLIVPIALFAAACGSDSESEAPDEEAAQTGGGGSLEGEVIRLAFPSTGLDDLAIWPAIETLEEQGVEVKTTEFAEQEDIVLAMAQGEVDIAVNMATPTVVSGIEQEAPIKIISSYTKNTQILVARNGIDEPAQLAGQRIGVHSEASFTKALAEYYQQENDIEAKVLIVPGSENRAQALGKDQLDASVISVTDYATLQDQYPDRFHVLESFTETLPELVAFSVAAPDAWLEEKQAVATAFVEALIGGFRTVSTFEPAMRYAQEHYSDFMPSQELLEQGVQLLVDGRYFPEDGLLTPETCTSSVEFLVSVNQIEGLQDVQGDKYCRTDIIDEARSNLG
jgi:ABC-type phosphate/phosphonate transport system substrate-binding protein